jgi:glycosyltransferase involved in cell wall biosynthesis
MKVLLVAWGLPPCPDTGASRALAITRQLTQLGAQVVALTASRETFLALYGADTDLERCVPNQTEMVRVPFFPSQLWPVLNDWPWLRINERTAWAAAARTRDRNTFPESIFASWLEPATCEALRIASRNDIDLVIATGSPYVDFEVAHRTHRALGIPLVLDDNGSFLFDVLTGEPDGLFAQRIPRYEDYLECCREYWCVAPSIAELHSAALPEAAGKLHVVENGWDPECPPVPITRTSGSGRRIAVVDTVTSAFPVARVLRAWRWARASSPWPDMELHLYGDIGAGRGGVAGGQSWIAEVRSALEAATADGVVLHGQIGRLAAAEAYGSVGALLLVDQGRPLHGPVAAYEYAATGLPIAGIGLDDLDGLPALAEYPRLHVGTGPDQDVAAILSAIDDANRPGAALREAEAQLFARRFEWRAHLRPALERVLAETP